MKVEDLFESKITEVKVGDSRVVYRIDHSTATIFLDSLRVPHRKRGQGHSAQGMKYITDLADSMGYKIKLLASPLDNRTNLGKLVSLYQKWGFELTGRTGNPAGDPWMERQPK